MKNKKIIICILFLSAIVVVSGCIKKETQKPVVNKNVQNINQNINKNINTSNGSGVKNGDGEEMEFKFELIGKDKKGWNIYSSKGYGFEIRYPEFLSVVGGENTSITNVQEEEYDFKAHSDGEIWIDINNVENNKIDAFNKIGQVEENYSGQLGNTIKHYYNPEFLNFDAVMSNLEYSNSEILLNPGIFKTLYFKKNSTDTVNIISAHIPNKNKKQIELFNEILKTIKLID